MTALTWGKCSEKCFEKKGKRRMPRNSHLSDFPRSAERILVVGHLVVHNAKRRAASSSAWRALSSRRSSLKAPAAARSFKL